jgi:cytoskeletal protein CcmA (bactofilin family)
VRRSQDIQAQLAQFRGILPGDEALSSTNDFAARLQKEAWKSHQEELEDELEEAIEAETRPSWARLTGADFSTISPAVRNILSKDVQVTGHIKFTNELIIDGKIEGEVSSDGVLTIGENADIRGDINTKSVTVFGKVNGNITVWERCELKSRARLVGNVKARRLAIEEGATFLGISEVSTTKSSLPIKQQIDRSAEIRAKEDAPAMALVASAKA